MADNGKIRRSAVVSTFGPGSVVDFRIGDSPVSAVVAGIDEWEGKDPQKFRYGPLRIQEPRLQRALDVEFFILPPVDLSRNSSDEEQKWVKKIPAVRFPRYLQCPQCNRIAPERRWGSDPGREYRYCNSCTRDSPSGKKVFVYPVRFIMACENGHLDEFPWDDWVEHKPDCDNRGKFLKLESKYPGLSGLILSCPECGAFRSMDGIFSKERMAKYRCHGKRPWLSTDDEECDKTCRAIQRGASNMYFPVTKSALSIPPWSDRLQVALGFHWNSIVRTEESNREFYVEKVLFHELEPVLKDMQLTPRELVQKIEKRLEWYSGDEIKDLRGAEYHHFTSGVDDEYPNNEFEVRFEKVPELLSTYFTGIVRAVRLKEIRALTGFTRIQPPGYDDDDSDVAPISVEKSDWLPAIEVRGEGIFLEMNHETLKKWEKDPEVKKRATLVNKGWQDEYRERYNKSPAPFDITPRFLLLHTLSHALMRQLTLECGYSGASLTERLYVRDESPEMCGILIYTATSDSDGTMGGLQRQGQAERIGATIMGAVKSMEWCSSDPLCIEGMNSADESHSLAACHACCLAPETSCEHFNRFLDRGMLVGTPDRPETGFFTSLLRED